MMDQESYQLKWHEIMAVMTMAGKTDFVGLEPGAGEEFTEQTFWDACCSLMKDGLLTQQNDGFCLSAELTHLLKPMCEATTVWGVTPADDRTPQLLVYVAKDAAVAMVPTTVGRYSLTVVPRDEFVSVLTDHMGLPLTDLPTEPVDETVWEPCDPDEKSSTLLHGAQFLLEAFDMVGRRRSGWLRVVEEGVYYRLQWSCLAQSVWEPCLETTFIRAVRTLTEGGNGDDFGGCHIPGI